MVACPDGKVSSSEHYHNLVEVRVEDGSKTSLIQQQWAGLFQARWSADGTGLFMTATEKDSQRLQLWHLPYPEGEPQQISNNLVNYGGVSLTADANSLISMQYEQQICLWLLPSSATEHATQVTFGAGREEDIAGLSWTPEGQIIYVSQASEAGEIWIINPDGAGRKHLTFDAVNKAWPAVTPDGRYIVYIANDRGVLSIWRMNIDGTNPKQLANIKLDNFPDCSPDGKWVVFSSSADGLWKVLIDGGTPVQLSKHRLARRPAISPNGKLIACCYKERPNAPDQLALFPFEGGEPIKVFAAPPHN